MRLNGSVGYSPGPEGGFGKARGISTAIPESPARLGLAFLWTEQLHHPPPDPTSEASPMSKVSHGPSSCEGGSSLRGQELGSGPGPLPLLPLSRHLWHPLCGSVLPTPSHIAQRNPGFASV